MSRYYVKSGNKVIGPLTSEKIRLLIADGRITPKTLLSVDKETFVSAEVIPDFDFISQKATDDLFSSSGSSTKPCPNCHCELSEADDFCSNCHYHISFTYSIQPLQQAAEQPTRTGSTKISLIEPIINQSPQIWSVYRRLGLDINFANLTLAGWLLIVFVTIGSISLVIISMRTLVTPDSPRTIIRFVGFSTAIVTGIATYWIGRGMMYLVGIKIIREEQVS